MDVTPDGRPITAPQAADTGFGTVMALFRRHDEGPRGRTRIGFGPHGMDTCTPELPRAIRDTAAETGCPLTIHAAQSQAELDIARERYGKSPIEHLRDLGLLRPGTALAHCVQATDADPAIIRAEDPRSPPAPMPSPAWARRCPSRASWRAACDLAGARHQPVWNPLQAVRTGGVAADLHTMLVDGVALMPDRRVLAADEALVTRRVAAAMLRAWDAARALGRIPRSMAARSALPGPVEAEAHAAARWRRLTPARCPTCG